LLGLELRPLFLDLRLPRGQVASSAEPLLQVLEFVLEPGGLVLLLVDRALGAGHFRGQDDFLFAELLARGRAFGLGRLQVMEGFGEVFFRGGEFLFEFRRATIRLIPQGLAGFGHLGFALLQLRAGLFHLLGCPSDEACLRVELVLGDREGLFSFREFLRPAVQRRPEGLHLGVPLLQRALLRLEGRLLLYELFLRDLRVFRGGLRFAQGVRFGLQSGDLRLPADGLLRSLRFRRLSAEGFAGPFAESHLDHSSRLSRIFSYSANFFDLAKPSILSAGRSPSSSSTSFITTLSSSLTASRSFCCSTSLFFSSTIRSIDSSSWTIRPFSSARSLSDRTVIVASPLGTGL